MELLRVSPSATGIKVELGYYKEWWKLCGNTFSSGILLNSKLDSAVIAYPDLDDAKPHALAFIVAGATGSNRWEKIEIILFSANEKGDKVFAYTLGGGEGSVREFTACNQFVNYGAYLSVADTEKSILYVTAMPEAPTPAWVYKIVPMDAMLGYIVKRLTLEELDAAATAEQQARDELAELRDEIAHLRVMREVDTVLLEVAKDQAESAERQWVALEQAVYVYLSWAQTVRLPLPALGFLKMIGYDLGEVALVGRVGRVAFTHDNYHETAEIFVRNIKHEGELRSDLH